MARWLLWLTLWPSCWLGAETLQDPTTPLGGVPATQGSQSSRLPQLQAVLLGPVRHKAVLDGQTYSLGDPIGAYRLQSIQAGGVTLVRDGQQYRIPLYSSKVKVE